MKIALISFFNEPDLEVLNCSGVMKKMRSLLEVFKHYNFEADLVVVNGREIAINGITVVKGLRRFVKYRVLRELLAKNGYKILYLRNFLNNGLLSYHVRKWKLQSNGLLILEVPTSSSAWFKEILKASNVKLVKKIQYLVQLTFLQVFLYSVADFIVVISEIGFLERLFRRKCVVISNGIILESFPVNFQQQIPSGEIHLIGVGNLSFWHGYDRIIAGIHKYSGNTKVFFHVVGDGEATNQLKELTQKFGLEDFVIFEGVKDNEQLNEIFSTCQIAVGSIGLHRKGMSKSSSLKHREYCARGIPFILSGWDDDFPEDFPFAYRVPADDEAIDIGRIVEWFTEISSRFPDYNLRMREYARRNLSWESKLQPLIKEIERKLGGKDEKRTW